MVASHAIATCTCKLNRYNLCCVEIQNFNGLVVHLSRRIDAVALLRCCVHKAHIISGDEREVVNVVESAVGITAFGEWYVGEVSRSGKREVERVGVPRWVDTYLNGGVGIGGQVVGVTG